MQDDPVESTDDVFDPLFGLSASQRANVERFLTKPDAADETQTPSLAPQPGDSGATIEDADYLDRLVAEGPEPDSAAGGQAPTPSVVDPDSVGSQFQAAVEETQDLERLVAEGPEGVPFDMRVIFPDLTTRDIRYLEQRAGSQRGIGEAWTDFKPFSKDAPYANVAYSIKDAYDMISVAGRIQDGSATREDQMKMATMVVDSNRGDTFAGGAADFMFSIWPSAGEFFTSGGIATAGKAATKAGLKKVVRKEVYDRFAKIAQKRLHDTAEKMVARMAMRGAIKGANVATVGGAYAVSRQVIPKVFGADGGAWDLNQVRRAWPEWSDSMTDDEAREVAIASNEMLADMIDERNPNSGFAEEFIRGSAEQVGGALVRLPGIKYLQALQTKALKKLVKVKGLRNFEAWKRVMRGKMWQQGYYDGPLAETVEEVFSNVATEGLVGESFLDGLPEDIEELAQIYVGSLGFGAFGQGGRVAMRKARKAQRNRLREKYKATMDRVPLAAAPSSVGQQVMVKGGDLDGLTGRVTGFETVDDPDGVEDRGDALIVTDAEGNKRRVDLRSAQVLLDGGDQSGASGTTAETAGGMEASPVRATQAEIDEGVGRYMDAVERMTGDRPDVEVVAEPRNALERAVLREAQKRNPNATPILLAGDFDENAPLGQSFGSGVVPLRVPRDPADLLENQNAMNGPLGVLFEELLHTWQQNVPLAEREELMGILRQVMPENVAFAEAQWRRSVTDGDTAEGERVLDETQATLARLLTDFVRFVDTPQGLAALRTLETDNRGRFQKIVDTVRNFLATTVMPFLSVTERRRIEDQFGARLEDLQQAHLLNEAIKQGTAAIGRRRLTQRDLSELANRPTTAAPRAALESETAQRIEADFGIARGEGELTQERIRELADKALRNEEFDDGEEALYRSNPSAVEAMFPPQPGGITLETPELAGPTPGLDEASERMGQEREQREQQERLAGRRQDLRDLATAQREAAARTPEEREQQRAEQAEAADVRGREQALESVRARDAATAPLPGDTVRYVDPNTGQATPAIVVETTGSSRNRRHKIRPLNARRAKGRGQRSGLPGSVIKVDGSDVTLTQRADPSTIDPTSRRAKLRRQAQQEALAGADARFAMPLKDSLGFTSPTLRAVMEFPGKAIKAQTARSKLKVRPQEWKWLRMDDFLDQYAPNERIPIAAIQEYIEKNRIELEQVKLYGREGGSEGEDADSAMFDLMGEQSAERLEAERALYEALLVDGETRFETGPEGIDGPRQITAFLRGNNERGFASRRIGSVRDDRLTKIEVFEQVVEQATDRQLQELGFLSSGEGNESVAAAKYETNESYDLVAGGFYEKYDEYLLRVPINPLDSTDFIETQHFPEFTNTLVFARVTIRESEEGERVLFIEEVQSDWHTELSRRNADLVPDAPLPDRYYDAIFNRMVMLAAEDPTITAVAWHDSWMIGERYKKSILESVRWMTGADGHKLVQATGYRSYDSPRGKTVSIVETAEPGKMSQLGWLPDSVLRQVKEQESGELKGKFVLGAQGYEDVYDNALPKIARDLAHRFSDGKTKKKNIRLPELEFDFGEMGTRTSLGLDITQEMREGLARDGVDLFAMPLDLNARDTAKWWLNSQVTDSEGNPQVQYHPTTAGFEDFDIRDIGVHFGTARHANNRLLDLSGERQGQGTFMARERPNLVGGERLMPVYLSIQNPLEMQDVGTWYDPFTIATWLKENGIGDQDVLDKILDDIVGLDPGIKELSLTDPGEIKDVDPDNLPDDVYAEREKYLNGDAVDLLTRLRKLLQEAGFDGIAYINEGEAGPNFAQGAPKPGQWWQRSWIAFEPGQVKSALSNKGTYDYEDSNIRNAFPLDEAIIKAYGFEGVLSVNTSFSEEATLTSLIDKMRVVFQDEFLPVQKVVEAVAKMGREIGEDNPIQALRLYFGRLSNEHAKLEKDILNPLAALLTGDLTHENLNEYAYAKHAEEANDEFLRQYNERQGLARRLNSIDRNLQRRARRAQNDEQIEEQKQLQAERKEIKAQLKKLQHVKYTIPEGMEPREYVHEVLRPSGMATSKAREIVQQAESGSRAAKYKQAHDLLMELNKRTRDRMVEGGLITPEAHARYEDQFDFYVPLRNDVDNGINFRGRGRGLFIGQAPEVKRRKGRNMAGKSRMADDVVGFSITQAMRSIERAEKNRAAQTFYKFVLDNQDLMGTKVEDNVEPDENGEIALTSTQFHLKVGGRNVRLDVADEALAKSLRRIHSYNIPEFFKTYSKLQSQWRGLVTTFSPEFVYTNMFRDVQTALAQTGSLEAEFNVTGLRKAIRANLNTARQTVDQYQSGAPVTTGMGQYMEEYVENGGMIGTFTSPEFSETMEEFEKRIARHRTLQSEKLWDRAKANVIAGKEFIERKNQGVESMARLALFAALRDRGVSAKEAAHAARQLTTDFNQKGQAGPLLSQIYVFFSASIGGQARMMKELTTTSEGLALASKLFAYGMASAVLNEMLSDDDEDGLSVYSKMSEYEKSRNHILMIPGLGPIKIPMPYGWSVFPTMGRLVAEVAMGHKTNGEGLKALGVAVADTFNPIGSNASMLQFLSPTMLDPLAQSYENKTFMGTPLRAQQNPYGPAMANWNRTRPTASIAGKQVARLINAIQGGDRVRPGALINPGGEDVDNFISFLGGGAGKFALNTGQSIYDLVTGQADANTLHTVPFVRKMVGTRPEFADISRFYDARNEISTAKALIEEAQSRGAKDEVRALRKRYGKIIALESSWKATQKQVKALREKAYDQPWWKKPGRDRLDRATQRMQRWNAKYMDRLGRTHDGDYVGWLD